MAEQPHSLIYKALVKAQAAMDNALRDSQNPHFKNNYADLASVRTAVMGPLTDNGLCVIQQPETDADGAVFVRTILAHESGETIHHEGPHVMPAKRDAQGVGSAITYLRRYNLMAVCGIAPDDDDGNAASGRNGDAGKSAAAPSKRAPAAPPPEADFHTAAGSGKSGATLVIPVRLKRARDGQEYENWKGWVEEYRQAMWDAVKQPDPLGALAELFDANAKVEARYAKTPEGNDGGVAALKDIKDKAFAYASGAPRDSEQAA